MRNEKPGEKHKIYPLAKSLRNRVYNVKIALEKYQEACIRENVAITNENTAKADLSR